MPSPGVVPHRTPHAAHEHGAARVSASGLVCETSAWDNSMGAQDAELLQRTVYALVVALNGAGDAPAVLSPAEDHPQPLLWTLRLDPARSVLDHTRRWIARQPAHRAGALAGLRELIEAGSLLPGFSFAAEEDERFALAEDLPLHCATAVTDEGMTWTLSAPPGLMCEAWLEAVLHQAAVVLAAICEDPDRSVADLAGAVRASWFDVRLISSAGCGDLAASLTAWASTIGLPLKAHRIEPEQAHLAELPQDVLQPRPWGADLVVIAPRLEAHGEASTRPAGGDDLPGRLPDGTPIAELNANETRELVDEIMVRGRYLRGGLQIQDGDVILDVGANIGIFALFAASHACRLRIHAFEPVPAMADALETNIRAHGLSARVERVALGARDETAELTYYPGSSLQSGLFADPAADAEVVRVYARHRGEEHRVIAAGQTGKVAETLAPVIHDRTAGPQTLIVPVRRLSGWIREHGIDRINLLKVDVERAEQDVLLGIDPEHWPLIDQVVAEVHDISGRVKRLVALLGAHGFDTTVEQDPAFAGSEIHMLYARRPDQARSGAPWVERQIGAAARWATSRPLPVVITALPGISEADAAHARTVAAAHALTWVQPPADGASLVWAEGVLRRMTEADRPVTKALVVDADNTLWGGVCGEVGPQNVDIGGPYRQVQQFLRRQHQSGRALALCSRNNLDDLRAVFAAHPEMPLSLDDFAAVHASWGYKSDAVTAIAEELGFAIESLVFIDDSPAERAEVARRHPAMTVVDLPADPNAVTNALHATWQLALETSTTEEDRARSRMISQEAERRAVADRVPDRGAYLRELNLQVEISPAADADVDRISQLAVRTTQFNLLLRRHTPVTVRQLLLRPGIAITVRVRDRFGDYGQVGFAFAEADADAGILRVRDFFLSCRALGRNVEWRLLQSVAEQAAAADLNAVELRAVAGARNRPARMFVQIAQTLFAARPGSAQGLLDPALLTCADWREVEALRQQPARRHQAPAAARDRRFVRWPASLDAAHHAAVIKPVRQEAVLSTVFVAPETAAERRIAAVWEEVLETQPIGVMDDLVALGGDSLIAALICVRLHEAGLLLTVSELLQQPTVRGCARLARPASPAAAPPGNPADLGAPRAASLGQERVWAAENIQQHTNNQIIPTAHQITGPLDLERLRRALEDVVARHPALRTTLDDRDGHVRCRLAAAAAFDLECTDLMDGPAGCDAAAEQAARAFFVARFDLERGPMLRAAVLRLAANRHLLLMSAHHSACDGWSLDIVHRDLSTAYTTPGARTDPPPVPFSQYQRSLASRIESGDFAAAVEEIHHALGPPTPAGEAFRLWDATGPAPHHVRFELDLPLTHSVRAAAHRHATTPFHLYLAAFQLMLAAAADTTSLVSGIPVANRHDPAYADTVGFIANLVPIRARIDWSADLGSHLRMAIASSTRALRHSDVPYGLLTQTRPAPGGLFDNLFTLQPPAFHPLALDGCQVTPVEPAQWPQPYPLMLDLSEHLDGTSVLLRIDTRAHQPGRADWIVEAYPLVLQAISSRPGLPLMHLRTALNPLTTHVTAAAARSGRKENSRDA